MSRSIVIIALLVLFCVSTAISIAYYRHQSRVLYHALQKQEARHFFLEQEFGRIQLERAAMADPVRVERRARLELKMVPVDVKKIKVVSL